MEDVIKTLDRYYNAFKDQERDWGFFIGLADYVNLLDEIPQLKGVVEKMLEGENKMIDSIHEAEKLAVQELKTLSKKILAETKKKKEAAIQESVAAFKDYDDGKTHPTWWHSARLENGIRGIIEAMIKEGYENILKKVLPKNANISNLYSLVYDICPAFSLRSALSSGLSEKRDTELWGNYRKLRTAATTFQKGQERLEQMKKEGKDTSDIEELLKEKEIIRKDGDDDWLSRSAIFGHSDRKKFSSSTDDKIKEFKRDKYQNYASRVHNHFVKELSRIGILTKDRAGGAEEKRGPSFDAEKSRLVIRGTEVPFRKFSEQYHALRIIFANPKEIGQEWFFSEIGEKIDTDKGYTDKQFHNYFSAIKRRVAADTGIKDLFLTTNQSVRINPEYLKI